MGHMIDSQGSKSGLEKVNGDDGFCLCKYTQGLEIRECSFIYLYQKCVEGGRRDEKRSVDHINHLAWTFSRRGGESGSCGLIFHSQRAREGEGGRDGALLPISIPFPFYPPSPPDSRGGPAFKSILSAPHHTI